MRLAWSTERVHAAFFGKMISLARVARAAGGHHIAPFVIAAARERNQVISREAFPMSEIGLASMAILAAVAIASEEECVGDLTAKAAGNVDELDESYDRWFGQRQSFASNDVAPVRFDDLGLAFDDQTKGAPDRDHRERLKRGV